MTSLSGHNNNDRNDGDDNYEGNTNQNGDLLVPDVGSTRSQPSSPTSPAPETGLSFSIPGLQVWVEGDGKKLPEYPYDEEDEHEAREGHRISKYVECLPNTVAIIKYKIERTFKYWIPAGGMAMLSEFELNDEWQDGHIDNFRYMPKSEDFEDEFEGHSLGRAEDGPKEAGRRKPICEPMIFAPILLCEDEEKTKKAFLNNTGTFKISFWRVTSRKRNDKFRAARHGTDGNPNAVSEKSVKGKAININVRLGAAPDVARNRPPRPNITYDRGDDEGMPLVSFVFHYREREALKQLHVIERTPEPTPEPRPEPPTLPVLLPMELKREHTPDWSADDGADSELQFLGRCSKGNAVLQITDDNDEETAEHDSAVGVDVSSEAQFPGRRDATPTQTEVVDERSANRVAVTSATPKMPVIDLMDDKPEDDDDIRYIPKRRAASTLNAIRNRRQRRRLV